MAREASALSLGERWGLVNVAQMSLIHAFIA
jgi:hypothetical protein